MLTIYKASAGSGKTFQLVVEYLKLLFKNPYNYKHILAVTFTNKATTEMKTRILEQLHLLASNQKSDYLKILQNNTFSEKEIRKRAKLVLKNILHDYNRFSISTIDSFTQRVIKSFNRELGIAPNYSLELDSDMILAEAVDRMLLKIDKDKKLLQWLKEFSKEKIEDNKSQRIEDNIKTLGKELFKENFQLFFSENSELVYSREKLESFGKELNILKKQFETTLQNKGQNAISFILRNDFSVDDFSYKKSGVAGFLDWLANGTIKEPGTRVFTAAENIEKWYTAKHAQSAEIHQLVESELQPLLIEILELIKNEGEQYYTVLAVKKQLRTLGILTDLKEEIKALLHEKGVLQISDSNLLLSKIIDQSDSPFIYEKTGIYYNHFMLDEFQDTSTLQWNNFKPLIINSLAEGNKNLIVGDVKQSIYRWRNSDWKILAEQLNSDFAEGQLQLETLEKNWRSDKNIIDFNNAIFGSLKDSFKQTLIEPIDNEEKIYTKKFDNIYNSFIQEPGNPNLKRVGFVKVQFLPADNFKEETVNTLVEQVKQLQDKGIKASEIAILIRQHKEGKAIIKEFLNAAGKPENSGYNLTVLSNESLYLHASKAILFVIQTIELLIEPENKITKISLLNLWINWLKPELLKQGKLTNSKTEQYNIDINHQSLDGNFNTLFETELAKEIEAAKEKIMLTSLDETITQISSQFQLFELENELPFLQTLIDKAGELKTSLSNDLSNLLFWWNEKGIKTSVNVNEEVDSIRLLTIHKSKGLEYKAVLLPYLDWATGWKSFAPTIWCEPKTAPFNKFPLLPIVAGTQMEKSFFKNEFNEEKVSTIIDTFNLIYVAFTRAKSALIVNCPVPNESGKKIGKSANHLLKKSLDNLSKNEQFSESWDNDGTTFQFGEIPKSSEAKTVSSSRIIKKYHFNDFGDKIKLRTSGDDFLITGEKNKSIKNQGKIIHDILSEIETDKDIKKACLKALNNGLINEKELIEIEDKLHRSLQNPQINKWFNGSYNVINERSLLTSERILRPDRIMISDDVAVVVDYKTGEKKSENYNRQVKRYAKTLKETGVKKVIGFLWYINQNEIEKVCEI
ncbi:MAG: AAA family ATPase [Draconibacterium sp.]|nr:AAA family ATPase [Draconibacterium sp.]